MSLISQKDFLNKTKLMDGTSKLILQQLTKQKWIFEIDSNGCVITTPPGKNQISIKSSDFSGIQTWLTSLKKCGFDDKKIIKKISKYQSRIEIQMCQDDMSWELNEKPDWWCSKFLNKFLEIPKIAGNKTWAAILPSPPFSKIWVGVGKFEDPGNFKYSIQTLPILIGKEELVKTAKGQIQIVPSVFNLTG